MNAVKEQLGQCFDSGRATVIGTSAVVSRKAHFEPAGRPGLIHILLEKDAGEDKHRRQPEGDEVVEVVVICRHGGDQEPDGREEEPAQEGHQGNEDHQRRHPGHHPEQEDSRQNRRPVDGGLGRHVHARTCDGAGGNEGGVAHPPPDSLHEPADAEPHADHHHQGFHQRQHNVGEQEPAEDQHVPLPDRHPAPGQIQSHRSVLLQGAPGQAQEPCRRQGARLMLGRDPQLQRPRPGMACHQLHRGAQRQHPPRSTPPAGRRAGPPHPCSA